MTLILYYHPFSSYCQKAMMALYEKELAFSPFLIDLADPAARAQFAAVWPYAKFPVLHDISAGVTLPESTIIAEYADALGTAGPRLIPADAAEARSVRLFDRTLDNYLHTPMQKIVGDRLRPAGKGDPHGVEEARATLATTYKLLESRLSDVGWMAGGNFTLADCAAVPPLFYAARVAPLTGHRRLLAYLDRAMQRASFRRCLDEARRFRSFFPAAPSDAPWPDEAGAAAQPVAPIPDQHDRIAF
jgi:glutathione S-transferase